MQQLRTIKKRIKTVSSIGHMTKAMKTLASARIRKTQLAMKKARLFEMKVKDIVDTLAVHADLEFLPLIKQREGKKTALIVLSSDTGFCGSYNYYIIQAALEFIKTHTPGKDVFIIALGKKVMSALNKREIPMEMSIPRWVPNLETADRVLQYCEEMFLSEKVDRVMAVYSKPAEGKACRSCWETLLPLQVEKRITEGAAGEYIFEPSAVEAMNGLLPQYFLAKVQRILLEMKAGELEARIRSMTNATENAEKLANDLKIEFFKIRQESITREIIEITSGAQSVK